MVLILKGYIIHNWCRKRQKSLPYIFAFAQNEGDLASDILQMRDAVVRTNIRRDAVPERCRDSVAILGKSGAGGGVPRNGGSR